VEKKKVTKRHSEMPTDENDPGLYRILGAAAGMNPIVPGRLRIYWCADLYTVTG
jgi:hypothetical protein